MPVHQPTGKVIAYKKEIDEWIKRPAEQPGIDSGEGHAVGRLNSWSRREVGFAAGIFVITVAMGGYLYFHVRPLTLTTDVTSLRPGQTANFQIHNFHPDGSVVYTSKAPSGVEQTFTELPLLPASNGNITFSFSPACKTQVGEHRWWAVESKTQRQSNTVAVTVSAEPRCEQPLPDLAAERVLLSATSVIAGQSLRLSITARNHGSAAAPECWSKIRLSKSRRSARMDPVLGTFMLPTVGSGDTVTQFVDVQIPVDVRPGIYRITIYLDHLGKILEADNDNNSAASDEVTVLPVRR